MLRLRQLKLPLEHNGADLEAALLKRLRLRPADLKRHTVVKRSVDARRRGAIALVYSLDLELTGGSSQEQQLLHRFRRDPQLRPSPDDRYQLPLQAPPEAWGGSRPVVVGSGPCGYFAALLLAQMGCRPVLLERGRMIRQRTADTFGFWRGERHFDPESNAQFGEGGAGTFSDGKLYSQVSEAPRYVRKVLEELVAAGANPEILTLHRPHIGTFKLATVVRGLRQRIEALGGEVRFGCRMEHLELEPHSRAVRAVVLADGERIATERVVLAIGHSARDSFAALHGQGVAMQPKPFAIGIRIEHPQALIDRARWGEAAGHPRLGAAEYKLVHQCQGPLSGGRAVYSFCMCPGGLVVGATSEAGHVVTNGMSQHSRNERNANSALVVQVELEDLKAYGSSPDDPLAGVAFQRHWEARAFAAGGGDYRAPAQRLGDFLNGQAPEPTEGEEEGTPSLQGSYQPGLRYADLSQCLPAFVTEALKEALPAFASRLPGFDQADALLTGVETRTSSPVRLPRHPESLECLNTPGLYPAGEGAGYAGGILSAAIDGIQVAERLASAVLTPPRPQPPGEQVESVCGPV